jgi:hypothetical protein
LNCADIGREHKNKAAKASTAAAVFGTKHFLPGQRAGKMYFSQRNLLDAVYRMRKMYRLTKFVVQKAWLSPRDVPPQSPRVSTRG